MTSRIKVKSESCPYCGGTARLSAAFVCECWRRSAPWVRALVALALVLVGLGIWGVLEMRSMRAEAFHLEQHRSE